MSNKEFGRYSQNPADSRQEYEDKRTGTKVTVGNYILSLHAEWQIFEVSTSDGSEIPAALSGKYTSVAEFRKALAALESQRKVVVLQEVKDGV